MAEKTELNNNNENEQRKKETFREKTERKIKEKKAQMEINKEQRKIRETQETLQNWANDFSGYFNSCIRPVLFGEIDRQGIILSNEDRYWVEQTMKHETEQILCPFFDKSVTESGARDYLVALERYKQEMVSRLLNVQKEKTEEKRQQKLTEIIGRLRDHRPAAHPRDAAADEINLFDED